ncbi:thiamine phosphate synthase [Aestuariispira insulae]|uniref:Thiamine-phosphate synthase n=1 Tax=Aestuariispira insulae TaxID=1461337 RepID=A0A3D9HPQ9_9PROT|nr:thiamine phosphate synthase [Aestuariispira insulae]RED51460.1 thiamine-phosphate diphosphorylase [Aestuariispira insulae]
MRTDGIYGFYPIVPDVEWVARLLALGVKTIQLRIKGLPPAQVEEQIGTAVALARQHEAQLVINDYWAFAQAHGAEFIHLGQEDLDGADLNAIEASGIKLGISTHSEQELDRALGCPFDHIALGPVYETTLKKMPWAPQGLKKLRIWKEIIPCPLVAIGGITLERAPKVLETGADSIAVVSDVVFHETPESRVEDWLKLFETR